MAARALDLLRSGTLALSVLQCAPADNSSDISNCRRTLCATAHRITDFHTRRKGPPSSCASPYAWFATIRCHMTNLDDVMKISIQMRHLQEACLGKMGGNQKASFSSTTVASSRTHYALFGSSRSVDCTLVRHRMPLYMSSNGAVSIKPIMSKRHEQYGHISALATCTIPNFVHLFARPADQPPSQVPSRTTVKRMVLSLSLESKRCPLSTWSRRTRVALAGMPRDDREHFHI